MYKKDLHLSWEMVAGDSKTCQTPGAFLGRFDSGLVTHALSCLLNFAFSGGPVVGVENRIPWSHWVELTQIDFDSSFAGFLINYSDVHFLASPVSL